jgi:hypothetical protein
MDHTHPSRSTKKFSYLWRWFHTDRSRVFDIDDDDAPTTEDDEEDNDEGEDEDDIEEQASVWNANSPYFMNGILTSSSYQRAMINYLTVNNVILLNGKERAILG